MKMDHLRTIEISISPTATIGDLKGAIEAENHLIWKEYQNMYTTSFLRTFQNNATLEECGIRDGTEVKMNYALRFDEECART